MSRKRRMFEIEMPDEPAAAVPETFPAGKEEKEHRRGPMATAITETAESTRDRARLEAQIRAENDALAQEHVRLKRAGLITDLIPLDAIDAQKLIRDRAAGPDYELTELVESIRDIGLSNPIRVEPAEGGRYELIQGWRRLSAYRQLLEETGDVEKWGRIPAGIAARGDELERLYRRMVDENMVRKDISFAEMAQLALHYAMDPVTEENDPEKAVAILFMAQLAGVELTGLQIAVVTGTLVGLTAGFFGGRIDNLIMRLVDTLLCFPQVFLLLVVAAAVLGLLPQVVAAAYVLGSVVSYLLYASDKSAAGTRRQRTPENTLHAVDRKRPVTTPSIPG